MSTRKTLPFLVAALAAACSSDQTPPAAAGSTPAASTPSAQTPAANAPPASTPPANAAAAAKDPIATMDEFIAKQTIDKTGTWKTRLPKPPKLTFDGKSYFWNLKTNRGSMKIKLMPDVAPMHVSSTIYLTRVGFYDGLAFHRVITGFMAQGGDPLGNGTGSPGYSYDGEFSPSVRHDRAGLLSMANRGPGTDGSQFFLTFKATPHLNDKHTIFGEVVDGMDVLKALESAGSQSGKTNEPLSIETATITVE